MATLVAGAISTSSTSSHLRPELGNSSHILLKPQEGTLLTRRTLNKSSSESRSFSVKCVARARASEGKNCDTGAFTSCPGTLYGLLGLDEKVTLPEIKNAYRKLALVYHPDVCPASTREESTRMFLQVQDAYQCLSDPQRRAQYDNELMCLWKWGVAGPDSSPLRSKRKDVSGSWRKQWEQQLASLQRKDANDQFSESWGARRRRAVNPN